MTLLHSRGIHRLLVEGGGELNWELLRLGLVDEIYVTVAPVLLGGRDAPTLLAGEGWPLAERCKLKLMELHREGDEIYCRYQVQGS
jgi:riboflavin biosynthesis pyrimidine reductase